MFPRPTFRSLRFTRPLLALVGGACLAVLSPAAAGDSITLDGSTIAMRNIELQQISSGRVFYTDVRGSRQRRSLNEVAALGFDDLPMLDEAEQALRDGQDDVAITAFLRAMHAADEDIERIWMHRRLAQIHDMRGEFVQSVGHAASAVALDPTLFWRPLLEPRSEPNAPSWPAVAESLARLQDARSAVRDQTLRTILDRLINQLRPVEWQAKQSYKGAAVSTDDTISGYLIADIEAGKIPGLAHGSGADTDDQRVSDAVPPQMNDTDSASGSDDADAASPPVIAEPKEAPKPTAESSAPAVFSPEAPERIDAMLTERRFADAVALCVRIAADPGGRSIPEFLVQYGKALVGDDKPEDAAVMFTRAAVLYPSSPHGVVGLIETARIYRARYGKPAAARRLLETAVERADDMNRQDLVSLADALLADLPPA